MFTNNGIIPTFIINLPHSTDRKEYMKGILSKCNNLSTTFTDGIEGIKLSESDICRQFDSSLAYKRYGRSLNKGEIGCTLSHYKCYKEFCESNYNYVLILEDDITILRNLSILASLSIFIDTKKPTIILLSGDYWYYNKRKIDSEYSLANICDGVGSYAYLINKAAAKLILKKNPKASCVADNWSLYKKQGVRIKAVYPYLIDANIEPFKSSIQQEYHGEKRMNQPINIAVSSYLLSLKKHVLYWIGHFVSKIR